MKSRVFLDTNVLVYADDADAGPKCGIARRIIDDETRQKRAVLSTQVLQEYYAVATRKLGMAPEAARRRLEVYMRLDVVQVGCPLILEAVDAGRLHRVSFWDALIVRAAVGAGCSHVYTEDLNDGQIVDGVRVHNPFVEHP